MLNCSLDCRASWGPTTSNNHVAFTDRPPGAKNWLRCVRSSFRCRDGRNYRHDSVLRECDESRGTRCSERHSGSPE